MFSGCYDNYEPFQDPVDVYTHVLWIWQLSLKSQEKNTEVVTWKEIRLESLKKILTINTYLEGW